MNKYFKYILIGSISFGLFSCKDVTSVYEEFVVPGGLFYPGQVKDLAYYSGENRGKIEAIKPIDPSVVEVRVFWNYFADSISVNVGPNSDTIVAMLNDLPENNYSFVIRTYDAKGNVSVPLEIFGASYGDNYKARLTNRTVNDALLTADGVLTIAFGNADISNGAFKTEIFYVDTIGNQVTASVPVYETDVVIDDIQGGEFSYHTAFKPDSLCMDVFYSQIDSLKLKAYLNSSNWSIIDFSTNHSGSANSVTNLIDGDPATRWHSNAKASSYPHWAVIDFGAVKTISEIEIFRMNGDDRAADKIQLLISTDNVNWTDLGLFDFNRFIDGAQSYLVDPEQSAQYLKYIGIESGAPDSQHVLGEIMVYGN